MTDDWLVVAGRRYQIRQLADLRTVRAYGNRVTRRAALISALVALAILGIAQYLSTAAWIAAGIVFAVPPVVLARELLQTQRRYELWADYQGLTVQVMSADSAEHIAAVRQALSVARQ